MITCDLRGQLGNQMFIIATVFAHALRTGHGYSLPERSGKRGQFPMMFENLPHNLNIEETAVTTTYKEPQFGIFNPLPLDFDHLHLQGYFQSEKYFKMFRPFIKSLFNIPKFNSADTSLESFVSIHIRRGDSLRHIKKLPQPTKKYLDDAVGFFDQKQKFLIFTDDEDWCRDYFKGDRFFFAIAGEAKYDMGRMASCGHNIIVNSTFSWWGAWLNDNPNKVVITPHRDSWFGDLYKQRLSAQDLVCDSWLQIRY